MLTWRDTQPVWEKLMELGVTVDEVVENLRKKNIKGFPRSSHSCPIAIYLETQGYNVDVIRFETFIH